MQHIIFTTREKYIYKFMYKCEHYIESIYYKLEQTAKYCRYLGYQIFQNLDTPITMDEFVALDVIMVHGGICQRELAKIILKDRANTGRILNSLEKKVILLVMQIQKITDL